MGVGIARSIEYFLMSILIQRIEDISCALITGSPISHRFVFMSVRLLALVLVHGVTLGWDEFSNIGVLKTI